MPGEAANRIKERILEIARNPETQHLSAAEIARQFGVSRTYVYRVFAASDVPLPRSRDIAQRRRMGARSIEWTSEQFDLLRVMVRDGRPVSAMARALGVTPGSLAIALAVMLRDLMESGGGPF